MVAEIPINYVHPAVRKEIEKLDRIIEQPSGIIGHHPILHESLRAQRNFVASREQIWAYNLENPEAVKKFMHGEGWEVAEIFAQTFFKQGPWNVDGQFSKEANDWAIFASLYAALVMINGAELSRGELLVMKTGLNGLYIAEKTFPKVNVLRELEGKIETNDRNYPIRPNKGWVGATRSELSEYHIVHSRPSQKRLRATMPNGTRILHPEVAIALEYANSVPPEIPGASSDYYSAYHGVIEIIKKIEYSDQSIS